MRHEDKLVADTSQLGRCIDAIGQFFAQLVYNSVFVCSTTEEEKAGVVIRLAYNFQRFAEFLYRVDFSFVGCKRGYANPSFIGWFLLVVVTWGLAGLFVMPYFAAANAAFYEDLLDRVER